MLSINFEITISSTCLLSIDYGTLFVERRRLKTFNKIFILSQKSTMPTTFFVESYPEWNNCFCAKEWAESHDKEWLMIKHYGEVKNDGSPKKEHYHTLIRTGNDMTLSAFSKNIGLDTRWIHEQNNWRETARYMVHESDTAIKEGKKKFPLEELEGNLKVRAIAYIRKKQNPGRTHSEAIYSVRF